MTPGAPVIETERLILRQHKVEDLEPYTAFMASDRARGVGGPYGPFQAWTWFASDIAQWVLYGHGALAIEERKTGAFAGQVSLNHLPHYPENEIGWVAFDGFTGKGYVTEAARAMRDFAYGTLGWSTVVSYIDRDNLASIAVAARLGATRDHDAQAPGPDDLVYRHPAPEALP
ncbi:MAG: GNAT family N-acetyltransferase [Pseudomonadota bacterium]